jgi:Ca2+-transporting ATPase
MPKTESRKTPFHCLTKDEVLTHLNTNLSVGLINSRVEELQKIYGPNSLPPEEKESIWEKIMEQFDDPMVKILLLAAVISFLISFFSPAEEDALPSWLEPLVIFMILIANGFVGIYQDLGAERSLEMLKKMEAIEVEVRRDSSWKMINSKDLVPGDIIRLKTGNQVPADCRVIQLVTGDAHINQSFLTGESETVTKIVDKIDKLEIDNLEKTNMMFSGSLLEIGTVICVVTGIGENTELGKIRDSLLAAQEDVKDDTTILKEQLDNFGDMLTKYIAIICLIIWVFNFTKFFDPAHGGFVGGALYYFKTAVALGVAAIPEGLPAVITTCLALGTRRMVKQNALVRKLSKVETLGCTTVICSDKTGTLTKNIMFARRLHLVNSRQVLDTKEVDGSSYDSSKGGIKQLDRLSPSSTVIENLVANMVMNTQTRLIKEKIVGVKDLQSEESKDLEIVRCLGNSTEGAILCLGEKLNRQTELKLSSFDWDLLWCYPFSSKRKRMSILVKSKGSEDRRLYVKGASDIILELSDRFVDCTGKVHPMTPEKREEFREDICISASEGYRVLALAYKPQNDLGILKTFNGVDDIMHDAVPFLKTSGNEDKVESGLIFQCVISIEDPVKDECKDAIFKAKGAGINVIMITGDKTETAIAIANQLDLFEESNVYKRSRTFVNESRQENVYTGQEWNKIDEKDKLRILKKAMKEKKSMVFSRTSPDNKRELVKMLKQMDEVVAMTGDGVNDAAALKQASIGISMGISGTDVAKEASDLILLDDNFATIVNAIEEGRSIYSNMKAFIRYMISSNIGEVFSIFLTCLIGIPEGLNSLQLLWVNLVTDGLPATALSFNKSDSEAMLKKPRRRGEKIVDNWILIRYLIVGFYVGVATTGIFIYYYTSYSWSPDQQPLINFWQLRNWGSCSNWITTNPIESEFENSCDYFSQGKQKASTLSLTVLVVIEMLNTLNALSENRSLFEVGVFSNLWLHGAILTSIGIHCLMLYVPFLAKIFSTVPLNLNDWVLVMLFSIPVIIIEEILKILSRNRNKQIKTEDQKKLKTE